MPLLCHTPLPTLFFRDVPAPCYPDAPSFEFEDITAREENITKRLPLCPGPDCRSKESLL